MLHQRAAATKLEMSRLTQAIFCSQALQNFSTTNRHGH
jgi:hypothetical protein